MAADKSLGYNVFFTTDGVDALKRVLQELGVQLDTLDKKSVSPNVDVDTRKATEKVGAFARELQTRIEAAIKALPGVELKADATDVDRRIAEIRAELADIGSKRVGVGVDATDASARVRELSDELRRLGAEHPSVAVRADTAEAAAKLDAIGNRHLSVGVETDTRRADEQVGAFARSLQTRIEAAVRSLPVVEIRADASDADQRIAAIRAELVDLADRRVGIQVDSAEADQRLRALSAELTELGTQSADVAVRADTARAAGDLLRVKSSVDELAGRTATARVEADTAAASENIGSFARNLQTRIETAVRALPAIELHADSTDVDQRVNEIRAELVGLSGQRIGVDVDPSEADAKIRALARQLTELSTQTANVAVKADTAEAAAKLDALSAKKVRSLVEIDTNRADTQVGAFARDLQRRIDTAIASLPAVQLRTGADDVDQRIFAIRAELGSLSDRRIGIGVDAGDAAAQIHVLSAELTELGARSENIQVKADTSRAAADLEALSRRTVTARVNLDTTEATDRVGAFARTLQARIDEAIRALPSVVVDADASQAQRRIDEIRTELTGLSDQRVGIGIDTAAASERIRELAGELTQLGASSPDIAVRADTSRASADLLGVKASADALDGRSVSVGVDTSSAAANVGSFARDLQARIETAVKALPVIELRGDATDAQRRISEIRDELARLADRRVGVGIDAVTAHATVRDLAAELDGLGAHAPDIAVTTDTAKAATALDGIRRDLNELDGKLVTADVEVNTLSARAEVGSFARDIQARIEAAVRSLPHVELKANATDVDRRIYEIRAELTALADRRVGIGVNADEAFTRVHELATELNKFGALAPTARATVDTTRAATALDSVQRKLDELTGRRVTPAIDVDTAAAEARIGAFARGLQTRIEAAVRSLPEVTITADSSDVDRRIAEIRAALSALADRRVGIGVSDTEAFARISVLTEELDSIAHRNVSIPITANTTKAATDLDGVRRKIDDITGHRVASIDVDTTVADTKVGAFARELQSRIERAIRSLPEVTLTADSIDVDHRIEAIRSELLVLANHRVGIGVDAVAASAKIKALAAELDALGIKATDVRVIADTTHAATDLDGLKRKIDELTGKRVPLEVDTSRADDEVGSFARSLQARVEAAVRSLPMVELRADSSDVDNRISHLRTELATLADRRIGIGITDTEAFTKIQTLTAKLDSLGKESVDVSVVANTTRAATDLDGVKRKIDELTGMRAVVDVDAKTSAADAKIGAYARDLETRITAAIKSLPDVEVTADSSKAQQRIGEIRAELLTLADRRVGVDVDAAEASAKVKALAEELRTLASRSSDVRVKVDTADAAAKLEEVGRKAEEAGNKGKAAGANLGLNTAVVNRWQQLGAAILVAATAAGPALLALGGVAAAGATGAVQTGLGVKTLFSGVGTGAQALETADTQKTAQADSLAAQQVSAANSVASANDAVKAAIVGVADAERSAALASTNADRAVRDSKRSVADAIRSEADAERSAGTTERDALYAQGQAEQQLQNDQQAELRAQQALTDARRAAQRQLEDLSMQMKDAALAEQGAVLNVEQAQQNLNKTLATGTALTVLGTVQDAYARAQATGTQAEQAAAQKALDSLSAGTKLQQEQAKLAYDQSVQQLEDQRLKNKQLADDKALADQRGIAGNQQVVAAQQGVTAATQTTQSAQHSLEQANAAVIEAQRSGAESVAKAQQQVATAYEALGVAQAAQIEARRAGQESIDKANQAEIAAQRSLQGALAQSAQVGKSSIDTVKAAMDQLSPAGQTFAHFIHDTLTPELHSIRDNVQAAGLPLMQQALVNIGSISPLVSAGLAGTATVIGQLAVKGSEMVTSGPWRADFATIMSRNNRVLGDFGNAGLATADAFRNIAASAGPLEERLAKLAEAGAHSFDAWIQGLRNSGQLDQFFHNAGDELIQLVKVMGQLVTAAISLINAVHPISGVVVEIIGHIADWIGMFARANPQVVETVAILGTLFGILSKLTGVSISGILKGEVFTGWAAKVETAATAIGTFSEKVPGLGAVGKAVEKDVSNLGKTLESVGKALPIVGVAVIGLSLAYDHLITSSSDAATAMLKGGAAADAATAALNKQSQGIDGSRAAAAKATGGISEWGHQIFDYFIPGVKQATEEYNKQRAALDPLARAQSDATRAQAEYARAIETNDPARASAAQRAFADATAEAARQTAIQTEGLKTDDQILAEHRDLLLGNLNGEIRVKDELVAVTKGVQDHGKATDLNTDAGRRNVENLNTLTATMNDNLTAMVKNGASQADVTTKTDEYKTSLYNAAIQIGYTKIEAQHYVDTVVNTPKVVNTTFANNAPGATAAMQGYLASVRAAQGAYVATFYANTNPAQQVINQFLRNNSALNASFVIGGMIPHAAGGIDLVAPMATGGLRAMSADIAAIVPPNTPTMIGDHQLVNESYIPWTRTQRTDQIFDATAVGIGRTVLPRGVVAPTLMAAGGVSGSSGSDSERRYPAALEMGPRSLGMFADLTKVLHDYTNTVRHNPMGPGMGPASRDVAVKYRDVALGVTPAPSQQAVQPVIALVAAASRATQPTAGGVIRGTSTDVRGAATGGVNTTALAGAIEQAVTRALLTRDSTAAAQNLGQTEQVMTRAVSNGIHGAELLVRDNGSNGLARIVSRQNRANDRR